MPVVVIILLLMNAVCLIGYWMDKRRAGSGRERISEKRLLQLSFLGPLGSIAGIWWIRHKTKKTSYLVKYFGVMALSITLHGVAFYQWFQHRSE